MTITRKLNIPPHISVPDPNMYQPGEEFHVNYIDRVQVFKCIEKSMPAKHRGDTGYIYHEWEEVRDV